MEFAMGNHIKANPALDLVPGSSYLTLYVVYNKYITTDMVVCCEF